MKPSNVIFSAIPALLLLSACAEVELAPNAKSVQVVESVAPNCKSLGILTGEGGNSWTGGELYKNTSLMQFAQNDLLNKAAAQGATHVVLKTANMAQGSMWESPFAGVSGSYLTGTAYKCN